MKAIIIEENNKGYYYRYPLTLEEFEAMYENRLDDDMPEPSEEAESYTLRPGVHLWYQQTTPFSELWNKFFTDMTWGLPESDIEDGNLATVDVELLECLIGRL